MIYAYYFKSESCDSYLVMTRERYEDVIEFMKHELPDEYEGWIDSGYDDYSIPYCDFMREEYDENKMEKL